MLILLEIQVTPLTAKLFKRSLPIHTSVVILVLNRLARLSRFVFRVLFCATFS
jgi:hypothetical protein